MEGGVHLDQGLAARLDQPIGAPRTLSKSAFARVVNLSPGRISQMIRRGLPVEPDGKIDIARGKIWIQENIDPRRSAAQPQGRLSFERPDQISQRERLAREQADNMALKNAALRRELVPAVEVQKEWEGMIRQARSAILAVPSRLRQMIGGLSADDVALIDAELRRALEELSDVGE